jgi:hypothetical protein
MGILPEAYALRKIYWQIFATLTLARLHASTKGCVPQVFSWLRRGAELGGIHFKHLLWVARFEVGRGSRGHYHCCLAGLLPRSTTTATCRLLESYWATCSGDKSQVDLYDRARDGVGYILKLPFIAQHSVCCEGKSGTSDVDCEPMLSKSLFPTLRRGRM